LPFILVNDSYLITYLTDEGIRCFFIIYYNFYSIYEKGNDIFM